MESKNKKILVILSVIAGLFVLIGLSFMVYRYFDQDKKEKEKIENEIVSDYATFRKKTEDFNEVRDIYYHQVANDLFLESVEEEYDHWKEIIQQYTNITDEVENSAGQLKNLCIDHYYEKEEIQNKCSSFVIAYETAINYYTKDLKAVNELIQTYQKENKENEKIKEFSFSYDYIDLNSDGKFVGKD